MKYSILIFFFLRMSPFFAQNKDSLTSREYRHIELVKSGKYTENQCFMVINIVNSEQEAIDIGVAFINLINSKSDFKFKKKKSVKAVLIDDEFWKVDLIKEVLDSPKKKLYRDVKFTVYIRKRNGALLLYTDNFKI